MRSFLLFLVLGAGLHAQTLPGGLASGALAGTYPSPTLRDFVSASDYPSVQAACAVAGATGMVMIPASYAGTDTTWNCGSTQVVNYKSYANTVLNAKSFGLRGDGLTIGDGNIPAGSNILSSYSHCFTSSDVAKQVKLPGGGPGFGKAADVYTTIASVSSCKATLSAPTVKSIAGRVFIGTDDTEAAQNMITYANSLSQATIYFPAGIYLINGTLRSTSSLLFKGDGRDVSILRQIHPTADLLILSGTTVNNVPNAFAVSQAVKDMEFMGSGMGTTGALLLVAAQSSLVQDVTFFGHAGTAILLAAERGFFRDINARNVRRVLVTSPNSPVNETYLQGFDFQDSGCVVDGELFNGTYYSFNINAVNGVYPTSGNLIQDQHTAVVLDAVTNFHIGYGSIKPTRCEGGVQITEANGNTEISHVYFENGYTNGYISPSLVYGGPHEKTTTAANMAASDTVFDIKDGSWFNPVVGNLSDLWMMTEGGIVGTNILLHPPDYLYGSTAASSLGGGILRGDYEYVVNTGIVRDQTGSGWHHHGNRAQNSTSAKAWPAGTVYEQVYLALSTPIHLVDNRFNSAVYRYDLGGYTVTCDPDNEKTCGEIVSGIEPDTFFAWASPNKISSGRGLVFTGNNFMGIDPPSVIAGNIEIHSAGSLDLKGQMQSSLTTALVNPISATNNSVINLVDLGSGTATRAAYANGVLPNLAFVDGRTNVQMINGNAANPFTQSGWSWQRTFAFGPVNIFGPLLSYTNGLTLGDPVNASGQPNHSWLFTSDLNTPGLTYKIWNNKSTSVPVLQVFGSTQAQVAANNGPWAKMTMNLGTITPTNGMTLNNSLQLMQLNSPNPPTIKPTVVSGSPTGLYSYAVVANQWDGSHTAISLSGNTSVGVDSGTGLSAANYNTISWSAPAGLAAYYDVYRTAGGPNLGKINATPVLTPSFVDTGLSGSGSAPSTNTTGCLMLGKTNTSWTCVGKMDVYGDNGVVRIQTTGTTLEFTNPLTGIPTIQSDASSLAFNVGSTAAKWTMNNDGSLVGATNASLTIGTGSRVKGINYYSATYTATAVAPQSCSNQNVMIPGLYSGDLLGQVIPPSDLGNVSLDARIWGTNTLRLHFCNPTTVSVTPPAGTYSVVDFR